MKFIALGYIVLSILALLALYSALRFGALVYASLGLVNRAVPYEKTTGDTRVPLLVLGDSTAVGVGADSPKDSLAGRVSDYMHASAVENYAESGAVVADLPGQIARAKYAHYRLILIQIGANDIIGFRGAEETGQRLAAILPTLPAADQVMLITAGNVGGATIMPLVLRPFYTRLTLAYHATFAQVAAETGITYVNLYTAPASDPFEKQPKVYLAPDGLHPSSAGYALWFERIKPALMS